MAYNPEDLGQWVDVTDEVIEVPNKWGFFQQIGLFADEPLSGKTVLIPKTTWEENLVPDRAWGARAANTAGQARSYLTLAIPHFPLDDAIFPSDIQGKVAWEDLFQGVVVESLENTRARKMEQLRRNHAITLEAARAQLIDAGTVYAPNGTVSYNMYTEHGLTPVPTHNIDLYAARDPIGGIETMIAGMQDAIGNNVILDSFLCICSPGLFSALVTHPIIQEHYTHESRKEARDILTGRLTASEFGLDARYRTFEYGGVLFVEYRGTYTNSAGSDVPFITAGEGRLIPLTDEPIFKTFYAPVDKFDYVNTTAQQLYMFEYPSPKGDKIEIESEQNFLNWCIYPQVVRKVTFTTTE